MVTAFGQAGASYLCPAMVQALAGTLSAVGEGAVVGVGSLAGGSGSDGIAFDTFVGPVG